MPSAASVSTRRVGAARRSAQLVQRSSSESSIQAAGRSPAYSSIASSVEGEHRELVVGQVQQQREVLVRLLLPAGRPHELKRLGEPAQPGSGAVRDAVRDPVDPVELPR
jgi:hypothetical protein